MAINFSEDDGRIILEYTSERQSASWLDKKLGSEGDHTFNNTFTVFKDDLIPVDDTDEEYEVRRFIVGSVADGYQIIDKKLLSLKYDLLISDSLKLKKELFVATRDISIFRRIDNLINEQIIVGGSNNEAIPETEFSHLLKNFPTSTELNRYADARVAQELKDYFETISDAEGRLISYMNRTKNSKPDINRANTPIRVANELEMEKYLYLRDKLVEMLSDSSSYIELRWQEVVAELFLLIFPQYIAVLKNVHLRELYSNPLKSTDRKFDLVLVDANGCIDLIEIKRPSDNNLVSKRVYRDNYVPQRELSGSIMQAEKYLFYLSKAGRGIEMKIEADYASQLPAGLKIKVANPKAIILSGRDNNLSPEQRFDLGFIRKKYSNMIDILSYDDLIRRVDNIIDTLKLRSGK